MMPPKPHGPLRLPWSILAIGLFATMATAQTPAKPPAESAQKKPANAAPPAPQSKHFPILLIASGTEPFWSLRIGMKGPERLERAGYPPIPLDPGDIEPDASGQSWLYHAKDSATAADVTVRLAREACSDNMSDTKYSFRVLVTHAQVGELHGCAKIAPEQFPEFKQKNLNDDDPDKKKPAPPAITNFKPPVAVAYLDSAGRVMLARGETPARAVAPKGSQLSLSHDGKRLLFTREDQGSDRTIVLYDATTAKSTELTRGAVQSAFWSPDDSQIAFLKRVDQAWTVWTAPAGSFDKATQLANTPVLALQGWQDIHTVLATDASRLYFLKTDSPPSSTDLREIYGGVFQAAASDSLRANPVNSDVLLISASTGSAGPGSTSSAFLFEIKSKRRVTLSPPNVSAASAEWSRDGLQIFFTTGEAAKSPAICRIFWDGSGFKRVRLGSHMVIGQ